MTESRMKILFLCTGNSCRSQMAEGWSRHLKGEILYPYSAGVEVHGLDPRTVKVMAEAGVDISGHRSKDVRELAGIPFDYVITLCSDAAENCPRFPGTTQVVHKGFDDPRRLCRNVRTGEEALDIFRRVRDEIRDFVMTLPESLAAPQ